MKKLLLLLMLLLTSCVVEEILAESQYDCGIVVGGDIINGRYRLLVSHPDGEFYHHVTRKAYDHYDMFDDICFDTIVW